MVSHLIAGRCRAYGHAARANHVAAALGLDEEEIIPCDLERDPRIARMHAHRVRFYVRTRDSLEGAPGQRGQ